jgi:hypothetical protein
MIKHRQQSVSLSVSGLNGLHGDMVEKFDRFAYTVD